MNRILSHILIPLISITSAHAEISGKLFHVDPAKRRFELLKETEYDPKTETGRSRFGCEWTRDAVIRRIEEKPSFAGIKGPVWVKLQGIDAANRKALAGRKPFVVR
ncbi:MAG TPA: hypothetical protein VLO11_08065, partial [Luteolibacter sp.]|nr:hypothetical protein [Luteolibacter sp.]